MEAHDPENLDGWLISRLRDQPPPSRLGELLLDESAAAARIEELETLVAELRAQLPPRLRAVPRGHGLFAPAPLERRWPRVELTDASLGRAYAELFTRYRFTAREDSDAWSEAAIDPEMLGKAFESLM